VLKKVGGGGGFLSSGSSITFDKPTTSQLVTDNAKNTPKDIRAKQKLFAQWTPSSTSSKRKRSMSPGGKTDSLVGSHQSTGIWNQNSLFPLKSIDFPQKCKRKRM
jgi:hypothetical protein